MEYCKYFCHRFPFLLPNRYLMLTHWSSVVFLLLQILLLHNFQSGFFFFNFFPLLIVRLHVCDCVTSRSPEFFNSRVHEAREASEPRGCPTWPADINISPSPQVYWISKTKKKENVAYNIYLKKILLKQIRSGFLIKESLPTFGKKKVSVPQSELVSKKKSF